MASLVLAEHKRPPAARSALATPCRCSLPLLVACCLLLCVAPQACRTARRQPPSGGSCLLGGGPCGAMSSTAARLVSAVKAAPGVCSSTAQALFSPAPSPKHVMGMLVLPPFFYRKTADTAPPNQANPCLHPAWPQPGPSAKTWALLEIQAPEAVDVKRGHPALRRPC